MKRVSKYIMMEQVASHPAVLQWSFDFPFIEQFNPDEILVKRFYFGGNRQLAGATTLITQALINVNKSFFQNHEANDSLTEASFIFAYDGVPVEVNLHPIIDPNGVWQVSVTLTDSGGIWVAGTNAFVWIAIEFDHIVK